MDKISVWCVFVIACLSSLVLITVYETIQHENAHEQIGITFGCIDTNIHWDFLGQSYFSCNNFTANMDDNRYFQMEGLHEINEIVEYNVHTINVNLIICLILLGTLLIVLHKA